MSGWVFYTILALDLLWLLAYVFADWVTARWLPWWRRYLPTGLLVLRLLLLVTPAIETNDKGTRSALALLAIVAFHWNIRTAHRNRRNGKDQRKLEASRSERLTEVQAASFRRQVMEGA